MKTLRRLPREHVVFMAFLLLLAALAAYFWLKDPSHEPAGKSRIEWPPAVSTKP